MHVTGVSAQEAPPETERLFCALSLLIFLYFGGTRPLCSDDAQSVSALRFDRRRVAADCLLRPSSEQLWMQIVALVLRRLVFFSLDAVGVGLGVLANARHLPGNFHVGFVGANGELVIDLGSDDGLRELSDRGQANQCCCRAVTLLPVRGESGRPTASRIPQLH